MHTVRVITLKRKIFTIRAFVLFNCTILAISLDNTLVLLIPLYTSITSPTLKRKDELCSIRDALQKSHRLPLIHILQFATT